MTEEEKTYVEMTQFLEKDPESLLIELKEKARYIEISNRKKFEIQLLQLAQETADYNKRNSIYEVLVSLQTIWNQNLPVKGLQEKFRAAFQEGNCKEAAVCYKKLVRQGLDYVGTFQTNAGEIIPLDIEEISMLMHYNEKEITLYNLKLEQLEKISLPEPLSVIHIHAPIAQQTAEYKGKEKVKVTDTNRLMFILLKGKEGQKAFTSINIKNIESIKSALHNLGQPIEYLEPTLSDVERLSFFQEHPLLISKKTIYYCQEKGKWKEWYTTLNEITAFESTRIGFWVGHSNGNVIILKKLEFVGNRAIFKGFSETVTSIRGAERYVLISSKKCLRISDHSAKQVLDPFESQCEIMALAILKDDFFLILAANGILTARELGQGNICWQMNLGKSYEMLFNFKQFVFCGKSDGETMAFEVPEFPAMAKELESKDIHVEKISSDIEPTVPIRNIADFIGRHNILDEIKEMSNTHFFLYGEPRVGKTSLLNVLRDVLSEKARCCVIDMTQLLKDANSYKKFQLKFMEICLEQHFMKLPEIPGSDGCDYQGLCSMISKIRGTRDFCMFGLDNFFIPHHFDRNNLETFRIFLRSMLLIPEARFILTYGPIHKSDIKNFFDDFKDIFEKRKVTYRDIPIFSEMEAKNALRAKISFRQKVVNEVYQYTGRFPHLIHLYDRWEPDRLSLEEQSDIISRHYSDKIFEYFRELSLNARLVIATCLDEKLAGEKTGYETFYDKFPFLKSSLPKDQLMKAIEEINHYGSGLVAGAEKDWFQVTLSDNAQLFNRALKHISWINDFKTLYQFTSASGLEKAHKVTQMFTKITQGALETNEDLVQRTKKYKDKFHIAKLNEQGMQALKMPLATFIVVPLTRWRKETHLDAFRDLCFDFQEINRKAGELKIFYTLLFELHGAPREEIKKELEGLERISIIDAGMMKHIIMADSPQEKASAYIFEQLSIKERSPYTTVGAVPDDLFFGRQMEIALIRGLPENIGVFGTRTIGKTSLLRRLHTAFKTQKGWKVYDMDCSRIGSEEALLKSLSEKMDISYAEISDLEKFRKYVTQEAVKDNHRYLFLLDEVDRLVEYDTRHEEKIFKTFNRLTNETMSNNETAARFILFGFQQMFEQMKNPVSRLYNFMVFLPLQALDRDGAMNLVTRPIEKIRVRWDKKEDAAYLVDNCSRHPRLLQAACHALLTNLDDKKDKRDMIERTDVDRVLTSPELRELCMRFYHDHGEEKKNEGIIARLTRTSSRDSKFIDNAESHAKGKGFLNDIHRITILAAVRLLFEDKKESFFITDIQSELRGYGIEVSPNMMRNILDQLCLSGNFRLQDMSTVIAKDETKIQQQADQIEIAKEKLTIHRPDVYAGSEAAFPRFTFEFGVKIFPKLLVAHFGGLKQCEEERKKLVEKGAWKEWLRRH